MSSSFVVGFNPVPMANQVAMVGGHLRRSALAAVLATGLALGLWWWQRPRFGPEWVAVVAAVGLVLVAVVGVRLARARRHLAHIGAGPALEAAAAGLVLHGLDGSRRELAWNQVSAVRTAGLKSGAAGPRIVVEATSGPAWAMPLSFLDALPGTIDAGLRATSAGRTGLDLSGLDSLF